jgi:hypothetical protein
MNVILSKKTAKTIDKAAWLFIQTCNANRGGNEFKPNEPIMKQIGVTEEELADLSFFLDRVEKKFNNKKQKK